MNILILGASGFLGGKVYKKLKTEASYDVLGTSFKSNTNDDLINLDITNDEEVKSILRKFKPDIILWSLMSSESEKHLIEKGLNNILKYLSPRQKLIFISSNAVFRGNDAKGNYSEYNQPKYSNGKESLDLYANAKIHGEKIVQQHDNYIIIRPGAIYGQDVDGKWDKRICYLINKLDANEEVVRTKNLYNTFVQVDELGVAILKLIKLDYKGIIHLGPLKKESYYNYYLRMARNLNLNINLIKSNLINENIDLSLNTYKCRELLGNIFRNN